MFLDFIRVFHMGWKNQLVGFWASQRSKMPKILINHCFFRFRAAIIDLLITLKQILFFLILYLEEFQPVKY